MSSSPGPAEPSAPANCVNGPATGGTGTTKYCEGLTGAVALIDGSGTTVALGNLPSVVEEDTGEAAGPAAISVGDDGRRALVYQDELVTSTGSNPLPLPAGAVFGTLQLPGGTADLASFAAAHPQSPSTFGGTPGETRYDSDPYDVAAYRDGFVVADAAANDLLSVGRDGRIGLLASFPTEAETVPPGVLGPNAVTIDAQAVPTSVAVGPDGALYVGLLRGVPSEPGTADIYRVGPGHDPTVWFSGLTAVTAIAFDAHGRLLATELSTGGLLAPPTVAGALVRITADGEHLTTLPVPGLFHPTGVAVGHDGTVYVSNHGTSTASSPTPGEVLRITGLG